MTMTVVVVTMMISRKEKKRFFFFGFRKANVVFGREIEITHDTNTCREKLKKNKKLIF